MTSQPEAGPDWGHEYGLVASEKWKAKSAAMGTPATEALVEYASPVAGMRVLDLASGTGEPAITLATRVGPQGQVTALDLSQELLEIAEKRARSRGLKNFRTQKADAHSLPFPDDSFDVGTSRFGVMFFRDPSKALGRTATRFATRRARLLSRLGRFRSALLEEHDGCGASEYGRALVAAGRARSISICRAGQFIRGAALAGFGSVEEQSMTLPWTWPGPPDEVWQQMRAVAVPFRPLLDRVPEQRWPEIDAEVSREVAHYSMEKRSRSELR